MKLLTISITLMFIFLPPAFAKLSPEKEKIVKALHIPNNKEVVSQLFLASLGKMGIDPEEFKIKRASKFDVGGAINLFSGGITRKRWIANITFEKNGKMVDRQCDFYTQQNLEFNFSCDRWVVNGKDKRWVEDFESPSMPYHLAYLELLMKVEPEFPSNSARDLLRDSFEMFDQNGNVRSAH